MELEQSQKQIFTNKADGSVARCSDVTQGSVNTTGAMDVDLD